MSMIDTAHFSDRNRQDFSKKETESGEVCIVNISPLERQKRLRFGIGQFLFTLIVWEMLIVLQLNPLWRLPLLFLFWASAVGYFQAREKT